METETKSARRLIAAFAFLAITTGLLDLLSNLFKSLAPYFPADILSLQPRYPWLFSFFQAAQLFPWLTILGDFATGTGLLFLKKWGRYLVLGMVWLRFAWGVLIFYIFSILQKSEPLQIPSFFYWILISSCVWALVITVCMFHPKIKNQFH